MVMFKNSFKLQNTDLRWYRDKYLTILAVFCFFVGISLLWSWPPPYHNLVRGGEFLAIASLCILISPQRVLIALGALGIIFTRGIVVVAMYRSLPVLGVVLATGLICYALTRWATSGHRDIGPPYRIKDYSYAELAIDCAVLLLALLLYSKLN